MALDERTVQRLRLGFSLGSVERTCSGAQAWNVIVIDCPALVMHALQAAMH